MKSLLEQVEGLDSLIHRLRKMDSMLKNGKFWDAIRECNRLISALTRAKRDLIQFSEENKNNSEKNEE
jgi:hypothetical protein